MPCRLYGRIYSSIAEKHFPKHPYVFLKIDSFIVPEEALYNLNNFKEYIRETSHTLKDGYYIINGNTELIKNHRPSKYGARTRRDTINLCSFIKKGGIIQLRQTNNKKRVKQGDVMPQYLRIINSNIRKRREQRQYDDEE